MSAAGLLWLPTAAVAPVPNAVVIALHDSAGPDPRGWLYANQITAAGIAVLHVELLETSADGYRAVTVADDALLARDRLSMFIDLLAADPRFANAPVGLLAFGSNGQAALQAAADRRHGDRIAGAALLYPGCASLAEAAGAGDMRPRSPILLLNGDADPSNPPAECGALAEQLARFGPVRHRHYPGAGYAWDLAPHGVHESVRVPWPGRPGVLLPVTYWPQAADLAATEVAAFFAAGFMAHRT